MILAAYKAATIMAGPFLELYLRRRVAKGKEDAARLSERRGVASIARPDGPLAWLHAASVGESLSILPVVASLRARGLGVLVTTGTVTSARLMAQRLPAGVVHQFVPVDRPSWVTRFLDHWRPNLAFWVESEIWPNLVLETKRRGISMVLLNGRLSARSAESWARAPVAGRRLFGAFAQVQARSEEDAARLRALGADPVVTLGDLKLAAEPLPADPDALGALRTAIGDRPCWLHASTHPAEDVETAALREAVAERVPGVLALVAPRHPERGEELAEDLRRNGAVVVARRGHGDMPTRDTDIYVCDTLGEMGILYRSVAVTVMGKSLVAGASGGQNPLEPARLGCPVVVGPCMENFAELTARMVAADAVLSVSDTRTAADKVASLLIDPGARSQASAASAAFAAGEDRILGRVMEALEPWLANIGSDR